MVYLIKDIISHLESIAPPPYQESYDNSQLLVGNPDSPVEGILCALDVTEAVVEEAKSKGCNLIIAHHPILFKGLKSLTGKNYVERTVIKAIKEDIAIYAIHTNLDAVDQGVNQKIAQKIGLSETRILAPKKGVLTKLTTFIPKEKAGEVLQALYKAGAGNIGNYSHCSFQTEGQGSFLPMENAQPSIGSRGKEEMVTEKRVELMFPSHLQSKIIHELKVAHPYEEVAYYLHPLENEHQDVGSGMIGHLPEPLSGMDFLEHLKKSMGLQVLKHTAILDKKVSKVALCGGAGIFLLGRAIKSGADVFVTADVKYHDFFEADQQILLADIGHYESEIYTKELLKDLLSQKFSNIATYLTNIVTNPISYL
ncbi:Nif3-like dinuclear metal center hexameric protein [Cyclobacterium plantarum]|uniref:GTP cyclohydrolase 1 type 2 homolog n=1 Tax=Cyclobacterium plantarum TaxID=2716263 RepID=A0ABX0HHY4_9BACT|nr:Nif3-like dinuclear metal center hexameric protein [Cyclobacterium plantarum]NHE59660.1 Nif3-like dinuclear metal center hexameric protein [Cyclobacterium plantarum]